MTISLEKRYKKITGHCFEGQNLTDHVKYIGALLQEIKKRLNNKEIKIPSRIRINYGRSDCTGCWSGREQISGEIYLSQKGTLGHLIMSYDERGYATDLSNVSFPVLALRQDNYDLVAQDTIYILEDVLTNDRYKTPKELVKS
jgi:hypothetical protein